MPRPKKDENSPKRARISTTDNNKRAGRGLSGEGTRTTDDAPPQREEKLKGVSGVEYRERKARLQRELEGKPPLKSDYEPHSGRDAKRTLRGKKLGEDASEKGSDRPSRFEFKERKEQPFEKRRMDRTERTDRTERKEGFDRGYNGSERRNTGNRPFGSSKSDSPNRYGSRDERSNDRGSRFRSGERSSESKRRDYSRPPASKRDDTPNRTGSRDERSNEHGSGFRSGERSLEGNRRDYGRPPAGRRDNTPNRAGSRDQHSDDRRSGFSSGERSSEGNRRDYSRPPAGRRDDTPNRTGSRDRDKQQDDRKGEFRRGERRNEGNRNEFRGRAGASSPHRSRPSGRPKPLIKLQSDEPKDTIRLNKYIADAGVCSRRDADDLIALGEIRVNGEVITEMGFQVKPTDVVKYGSRLLKREKLVYILMNKPKDFITTLDDPEERKTVIDLLGKNVKERVYPVGRLDRNTTGLLLLTNDGELADKLSHPSGKIKKVYQVEIDAPITKEDIEKLRKGVTLDDGPASIDSMEILEPNSQVIGLELHSGRNRIVRRLFEHLGYKVTKLDRVLYADLTKKDLPRGSWRYLTEKEVIRLKYFM